MAKFLLILLVGLTFESAGVVLLSKGIKQIGDMKKVSVSEIARIIKAGATSPGILLGVFFEALFFGCLLFLMSKSEISLLWPLTGLSFVFATFAAKIFLDEKISPMRWGGVVLVVMGAVLIGYSQKLDERGKAASDASNPPAANATH